MKRTILILICVVLVLSTASAQRIIAEDKILKEVLKEKIKKAKSGDAISQFIVGFDCIYMNEWFQKDENLGLEFLNLAAKQNYMPAFQELGKYWISKKNYNAAEPYLRKALDIYDEANKYADKKEKIVAMLLDVAIYYTVKDKEPIYDEIIKNMNGNSLDCFSFLSDYDDDALDILYGYYFKIEDYAIALKYCNKAYDRHIPSSGYWLGRMYEYGLGGVPRDKLKAIEAYELGANSTDATVNQICRRYLSRICYELNIMDKAFKYSYDYAHNDVYDDMGTGDILHNLAACYRFGRGTKKNIQLANIWDALGILYRKDYKADIIAEYKGFDSDNDSQAIKYVLKLLYEKMGHDVNLTSCATFLSGIYNASVEMNWMKGQSLLIKSYYMEDAIPEVQALSAFILNSAYKEFSSLKTEDGERMIDDFINRKVIDLKDLEVAPIFDDYLYKVFVRQIKTFEEE